MLIFLIYGGFEPFDYTFKNFLGIYSNVKEFEKFNWLVVSNLYSPKSLYLFKHKSYLQVILKIIFRD